MARCHPLCNHRLSLPQGPKNPSVKVYQELPNLRAQLLPRLPLRRKLTGDSCPSRYHLPTPPQDRLLRQNRCQPDRPRLRIKQLKTKRFRDLSLGHPTVQVLRSEVLLENPTQDHPPPSQAQSNIDILAVLEEVHWRRLLRLQRNGYPDKAAVVIFMEINGRRSSEEKRTCTPISMTAPTQHQ